MRILIIGGKSSLGSELKLFLKSYFQVFTAGRSECDIYLDLSKNCDTEIDFQCDVVILTAAVFGGNDLNSYEENIIVNVLGTARSIKIANKFGAKHFILISSMSILLNQISPNYEIYSITKRQSEEVAEFVTNSIKMPLTILRPTQLYGDNESFKKHQPLLYKIIECVEMNKDVTFHGKKNSIRNYLHVNDFNEIIRKVIDLKVLGKYNCVNTKSTTLIETFNAAINAFNSNSNYHFDNSEDDIIENKFQADFDFFLKIDFVPQINIINGMEMIANSKKLNYFN
jgi:nucleoside-diphosphate-sugar epimerase